ncbi:MAG: NAD(P)-binding protein [Lentisphaeria bacterium]|nr:NAD(P)-binding protein [Lentisphaeria bacterium]
MPHVHTIILGAGPAGLSFAHRLLQLGDTSFVVFEKENEAGGLCRSQDVDGAPLDMGGGHFLDVRRPDANAFLFTFLPEDQWDTHHRKSTITVHGQDIDYPFEANLWQFPADLQQAYLDSIAQAGCLTGEPKPDTFPEWVTWKLGDKIARDYMIPYNEKIWCLDDLNELGTYWLYKLPDVSFEDTLRSCREKRLIAKMPGHANFYYPKEGGYGHVWRRMGDALGGKLLLNRAPATVTITPLGVDEFTCDRIITTIPWPEFVRRADVPDLIADSAAALKNAPVEIAYYPDNLPSPAHWTYVPSPDIKHHRLLLRHNFCPASRGYWTETNAKRAAEWGKRERPTSNAQRPPLSNHPLWKHVNDYAYPLNTVDKPEQIKRILDWGADNGIVGLGRWGEWEHMNSDAAVEAGMRLAETLV